MLRSDAGDALAADDHAYDVKDFVAGDGEAEREDVASVVTLAFGWGQACDVVRVVQEAVAIEADVAAEEGAEADQAGAARSMQEALTEAEGLEAFCGTQDCARACGGGRSSDGVQQVGMGFSRAAS